MRPVWAEISLAALLSNYRALRARVQQHAELLAVVKANAYGHDLRLCAPALANGGASWFGVTGAHEGQSLRVLCGNARILLMSGVWPGEADAVIDHKLVPVVWEKSHLDILEEAAQRRGLPAASLPVHLEIDTGMSRQGVHIGSGNTGREILSALLEHFRPPSPLELQGISTHFLCPEVISSTRENPQIERFEKAIQLVQAKGLHPQWVHAGNSSTIAAGGDLEALASLAAKFGSRLMVRPGLALYGYLDHITCDGEPVSRSSVPEVSALCDSLRPVMSLKARVTSLRTLDTGDTVGYDGTFTAQRTTRVALLPLGYADGVNRLLSNCGQVLIRGKRAPIAGRISMDQVVVDVTGIPLASIGDEAVLIGEQGGQRISAWDIAELSKTVPWEVLCAVSARVPRISVP